jgi:hypothetical protein
MRPILAAILGLVALAATSGGAGSDDSASAAKPSESTIIEMAQKLVLVHFARGPAGESHVAFDIANVYPQASGDYWAVVGGFIANPGGNRSRPHAYGMAMRLVCAEHENLDCWRLEKLVIDQKVILDK